MQLLPSCVTITISRCTIAFQRYSTVISIGKLKKIASEAYTHWTPPEMTVAPVKREADDRRAHSKRSHSPTNPPVKLIKKRKTAAVQHEPTSATTSAQSAPTPMTSATILVHPLPTSRSHMCQPAVNRNLQVVYFRRLLNLGRVK